MSIKLRACAAAALLLCGSAAFAQPNNAMDARKDANATRADERQDRTTSLRDDAAIRGANRLLQEDDKLADEHLHRAAHETGKLRETELAQADHYKALAQAERAKIAALSASGKTEMKDYRADRASQPH